MSALDDRHRKVSLPCVRVRTAKAGGSGTIIYSVGGSTYVLTNHHVVADSIKIEKKWSTLLKREIKTDSFDVVDAHLFSYRYESRAIGGQTIQSDIAAYDPEEDLALLRLRSSDPINSVAALYPRGKEIALRVGMEVIAAGAGMGYAPVQTEGILSQFGQEIDRREYWLNTAPSIFGNSGGALFLKDTFELIGVPSRITVASYGFSADAITHLGFAIPITRIYGFLEDQKFRFIFDADFTEEGEDDLRAELREREERRMAQGDRNEEDDE